MTESHSSHTPANVNINKKQGILSFYSEGIDARQSLNNKKHTRTKRANAYVFNHWYEGTFPKYQSK